MKFILLFALIGQAVSEVHHFNEAFGEGWEQRWTPSEDHARNNLGTRVFTKRIEYIPTETPTALHYCLEWNHNAGCGNGKYWYGDCKNGWEFGIKYCKKNMICTIVGWNGKQPDVIENPKSEFRNATLVVTSKSYEMLINGYRVKKIDASGSNPLTVPYHKCKKEAIIEACPNKAFPLKGMSITGRAPRK